MIEEDIDMAAESADLNMHVKLEEELQRKTVAQLKVIVSNYESSSNKFVKLPTRKAEIIRLIIENDMYKLSDLDFEKRVKPAVKRSLSLDPETDLDVDEQTTTTTSSVATANSNASSRSKSMLSLNPNPNANSNNEENPDTWFNKPQLETRTKRKAIKSFDDFDQRAGNIESIDDLFKYYFGEKTSLEIFTTTKFPIHGTIRCSNYLFRRWHFICLTCSTPDVKYCTECFLNGIHRDENHRFSLVYSPNVSCVCDCGDGDLMKESSFCTKHRYATNVQQKENYINHFPAYLRDAFKTFFNKLVTRALFLNRQASGSHELEITNITTYLGKAASRSPLYAKLIAEELTLLNLDLSSFDISNPSRIISNNALTVTSVSHNKRQKTIVTNSTPLYTLFHTHLDFSTKYFYLFASVSYHNLQFAQVFFQHYLANFSHLMRPQPRIAIAESCYHLQQFYKSPSRILTPFATGKVKTNLFVVLFHHYKYNMDIIYQSFIFNRTLFESHRFESKLFSRLLKMEECAVYFSNNKLLLSQFLEVCQVLHSFTSFSYQFGNVLRELKDLIHLESCIINGFNHMLQHLSQSKIDDWTSTVINQAMEYLLTNIKHPTNSDKGARIFFPLPRIIALCLLYSSDNIDYFVELVKSESQRFTPCIADMIFDITTFRSFFYEHNFRPRNHILETHVIASPTDEDRYYRFYTQKFMMLDFLMLQMALLSTSPSIFLNEFLNESSGSMPTNSELLKIMFEILINVLQTRATLNPSEEDIEYHYIQAAASGYFYYSEMLNFKFIFKNVPVDVKEKIIAKVVKDVKAPKMQLKPEYWNRYNPYYWNFEFIFKMHLHELAREEFAKYQAENNLPESLHFPPELPPLHPKLEGIYRIYNDDALYQFLHYVTMKIIYPNFKSFKIAENDTDGSYSANDIFKDIAEGDIIIANDIYYILLMAISHFDQWIGSQSQKNVDSIHKDVSSYLLNANYIKHPQQRSLYNWKSSNFITLMLKAYVPSFKNIRKKQAQSFLDTLIHCYKINSSDQNPLLQKILVWFGQFDESISKYFEMQGITDFDPKKREQEEKEKRRRIMQEKRDEIMRQMKEKQNQFLQMSENQELYDELESTEATTCTTPSESDSVVEEHEQHEHSDDSADKVCMICRDRTNTEPLYAVAKLSNCSLALNQKLNSLHRTIRKTSQSHLNTTVQNLLLNQENVFFDKERFPARVTKSCPMLIDFFKTYYRLSSYLYTSSCLHYTHTACIDQSVYSFEYGFQCPQCNASSNILIPVDVTALSLEEIMRFFFSIQDPLMIDGIFERHLWGAVHSNIDVFEMKTREISNYIVDPDQGSYHLLTDLEFKQELATLKLLFRAIAKSEVAPNELLPQPEDEREVDDHIKFHVDPFLLSTYTSYLKNLDYKITNAASLKQYVFNYLLMETMKLPGFKITQCTDSIHHVYENLKNNQSEFNNYLFPFLRKSYLYHCLASCNTQPALINQLSQQNFSDFDFIKNSLEIGDTTKLITQSELDEYITRFLKLKKGFVSYIPSSYLHIPKLKKLHPQYIDFIIKNIPNTAQEEQEFMCKSCERTQVYKCLSCGWSACVSDCIYSFVAHPKECPGGFHQVCLFIDITTGLIKEVDVDREVILYNNDIITVYFNEYNEPSTITNNQLTLSNKHLRATYKKWIQMMSTNTIQSMDIDIPNFLV